MKTTYQKIVIFFAALALILMPSCSNEEYLDASATTPDQEGVITFRIQGKKQPVSYAIATENENAVDSLSIYMFNDRSAESKPNLLLKTFHIDKASLAQTGADLIATINVADRTGKHIFYFVANGKGNASALENVYLGKTTEDDFKERLTDIQANLIASPLLMTARQEIADVKNPTDTEKKVKLYRRVARFDIVNDASVSNFTIDNILIDNAATQGYIFSNATDNPAQTLATGKLPIIENKKPTDFNTGTPVTGAFYLYPTKLDASQTTLSFEGQFMGEQRIYNLKSSITIEANKRYVLNVKKDEYTNIPDLTIEVVDWEDGGSTHEMERETNDVTLSEITMTGGKGVVAGDRDYDITHINEETTLSFTVESYQVSGTTSRVTGNVDDLPGFSVTATTPVLTYAAHYHQEYTIVIPERTDLMIPINIKVEIVNQTKPEQPLSITIHGDENLKYFYPGTRLEPVVVGGVTWAPINVGATEIGTTKTIKHMGYIYKWGSTAAISYYTQKMIPSDVYSKSDPTSMLRSGTEQQGPCPEGWYVPSSADLQILVNTSDKGWDSTNYRFWFKSDDKKSELYLPAAGALNANGTRKELDTYGHYWSSERSGSNAVRLYFYPAGVRMDSFNSTEAYSVRCVKK